MRLQTTDQRPQTWAFLFSILVVLFLLCPLHARASDFDTAKQTIMSGQVEAGAQMLARVVQTKSSPEALLLMAQTLDRLQDYFSERVEKTCYWGREKAGTPACAQNEAEKLNAIYGAGAFKFVTDIAYVPYTGIHYRELVSKFGGSKEAKEAEFQLLLRNLVGHPKDVLLRVKAFMEKNSSGDVGRKAILLWARVNEDIWYIHRSWSWVIYNETISPDELIVKAEPYRQEAMKTFEKIISKYGGTFEGEQAKRELSLLRSNQFDGETYSILQDTVGGSPDKWGNPVPKPALTATQRGVGAGGWQSTPPAAAPGAAPVPSGEKVKPEPTGEKKPGSQRWQ